MSEILIQNVSKTYSTKDGNVQALKNVNLSIEQGDIYGIIGMSGAGKSTLVSVSYAAAMNLHIKVLTPGNNHHMMEAMFKAFAKALDMAVGMDSRITDVLSTKGSL